MLLKGEVAVIYGAGGAIGGAIARAFAKEGARTSPMGPTRAVPYVVDDAHFVKA